METNIRIFKTAWFAKAARKAGIDDVTLEQAVRQVIRGQAVDMGGGVFKKRLNQNRHRAIVLTAVGNHWVLEYLFAKQDRTNIAPDELTAFRKLARVYAGLSDAQVLALVENADWMEIGNAQDIQE